MGAFGNMAGCYVAGVGFDKATSKRLALAAATLLSTFPYLLFLVAPAGVATVTPLAQNATAAAPAAECGASSAADSAAGFVTTYALTGGEKALIFFMWVLCSVGYGALYTVQTGQMRLLADSSVAAAYSGLCMGMLAVAAAAGTYVGGALAEAGKGGYDYEACYKGGAYASLGALAVIPWITTADAEVVEFKAAQRAESVARGGGKVRPRRKSFMDWVGAMGGSAAMGAVAASDAAAEADAAVAGAGGEGGPVTPARPMLRRPALGSMAKLLDARVEEDQRSLVAGLRRRVRAWFDDRNARARARSRRKQSMDWAGSGEDTPP